MVVVPFLTTVHSSRSSAIDPQTCSPTGQRGSWCPGVDYILTRGPEPAGRRPLPTWGCHSRGLVLLFGEWVWQGRRLEEASYLVISRWGEQLELRGVGITITQQIQKPPLGLWGPGSGMFFALTPSPPSCVPQVWDPAWGCRPHPRSSKPCEGVGSTQRKELLPGSLLGGDLSRIVCAPGLLATGLSPVGRDPSGAQGGHVDLQSHLSLHKAGG